MTPIPSRHAVGTLGFIVDKGVRKLVAAGIEAARLDARVLAARYLACPPEFVLTHPETPLSDEDQAAIGLLIDRRVGREPLSHIVGEREFWSLPLTVNRATLSPRPETETLVEMALDWVDGTGRRNDALRILDLGTGTGCLLLALLSELPMATGLGIDTSKGALATAEENAERLGFADRTRFVAGDWGHGLSGAFDLIVSNPPYVAEDDRDRLPPEVLNFDPPEALFAGKDGLSAYKEIAPTVAGLLVDAGSIILEVGQGQAPAVAKLFVARGLELVETRSDLAGIPRALRFGLEAA